MYSSPPSFMLTAHIPMTHHHDAGLKTLVKLFEDPAASLDSSCQFIVDRYHYVVDKLTNRNYGGLTSSLIWAAVGNTMPVAFWVLYFLLADPEAMKAIREEVDAVAAEAEVPSPAPTNNDSAGGGSGGSGGGGSAAPTLPGARIFSQENLDKMKILHSTVHEAMRLTSGSIVMRIAAKDTTLNWKTEGGGGGGGGGGGTGTSASWKVAKGDRICFYPPLHHHDKTVFGDDCMEFSHTRFVGAAGVKLARDNLLIFGGGVSMCPGRYFAFNEVKAFVATMVSCCNIELAEGQERPPTTPIIDPSRVGLGIFSPLQDLDVRITAR